MFVALGLIANIVGDRGFGFRVRVTVMARVRAIVEFDLSQRWC